VTLSTDLSTGEIAELASLCAEELFNDDRAERFPQILLKRPTIFVLERTARRVVGACFGSVAVRDGSLIGYVDLLIVRRKDQRKGIGRELLGRIEERFRAAGCSKMQFKGNPPHYLWPGIDINYISAICLAEDLGYSRTGCAVNMIPHLSRDALYTQKEETQLRKMGISVRRAGQKDTELVERSLAPVWETDWVREAMAALASSEAGLQIATTGDRCIGFCANGINRVEDTGPMGIDMPFRNRGIGSVLLKRCVAEQIDSGVAIVNLQWTGPISFFSRALQATIKRTFWVYELELD